MADAINVYAGSMPLVNVLAAPLGTSVMFELRGSTSALVESFLALPHWMPASPKRVTHSHNQQGWWKAPDPFYDNDACEIIVCDEKALWRATNHRSDGWRIRRIRADVFGITIWPLRSNYFLGGPDDEYAQARAIEWHRRMVCARSDTAFQRLLKVSRATPSH